jgi:hypothetical protein
MKPFDVWARELAEKMSVDPLTAHAEADDEDEYECSGGCGDWGEANWSDGCDVRYYCGNSPHCIP